MPLDTSYTGRLLGPNPLVVPRSLHCQCSRLFTQSQCENRPVRRRGPYGRGKIGGKEGRASESTAYPSVSGNVNITRKKAWDTGCKLTFRKIFFSSRWANDGGVAGAAAALSSCSTSTFSSDCDPGRPTLSMMIPILPTT